VGGLTGIAHTVVFHYDSPSLPLIGVFMGLIFTAPALRLREYIKENPER